MKFRSPLTPLFAATALVLSATSAQAQIPNTFSNGQVANADTVNANFDYLETERAANQTRIAQLEAINTTLSARLDALEAALSPANATKLAAILPSLSLVQTDDLDGTMIDTVRFTGVNVQIVNGTGATQTTNSAGNLLLGYGETTSDGGNVPIDENRTGSHNIVMGEANTFSSVSGFVSGFRNYISANGAIVLTGSNGQASEELSVVVSGLGNQATGPGSAVVTGSNNTAAGLFSSVIGGSDNLATGDASVVTGGGTNTANGDDSVVSGGDSRTAAGTDDWVAGSLLEDD